MITIRRREYKLNDQWEKLFSKMDWQVNKSTDFLFDRISTHDISTNKKWIGEIDRKSKSFSILKTREFPRNHLPLVFAEGKIVGKDSTSVKVNYKLGPFTMLFYMLIFGSSLLVTFFTFTIGKTEDLIVDYILWIIALPILSTLILMLQLNNLENDFVDLIDE